MEVFGPRWQNYISRLERNWRAVINEDDVVVVPGDISWAMSLEQSLADFEYINSLPGKKWIIKGNHDYWWNSRKKMEDFFEKNGLNTIGILHNSFVEAEGVDEDKLMEDALEAGASDFITDEEGVFEIRTEPNDCGAVREDLEAKGYTFVSAEVEYVPSTYTALTNPDDIKNMAKMLEMFEDNDDVQAVWHNWENADDAE